MKHSKIEKAIVLSLLLSSSMYSISYAYDDKINETIKDENYTDFIGDNPLDVEDKNGGSAIVSDHTDMIFNIDNTVTLTSSDDDTINIGENGWVQIDSSGSTTIKNNSGKIAINSSGVFDLTSDKDNIIEGDIKGKNISIQSDEGKNTITGDINSTEGYFKLIANNAHNEINGNFIANNTDIDFVGNTSITGKLDIKDSKLDTSADLSINYTEGTAVSINNSSFTTKGPVSFYGKEPWFRY